jgi:hypothetical protein
MLKPVPAKQRSYRNNPWEVLVVAALFLIPGTFMVFHRGPMVVFQQSFRWVPSGAMALSEHGVHIFGLLAICVTGSLILFYFYLRRAIERDDPLRTPRWR